MEVEIKGEDRSWKRDRKGEKRWRGMWNEEGCGFFRQRMGKIEGEDGREMGWKEMEERIKEVLREVEEREGDKRERG